MIFQIYMHNNYAPLIPESLHKEFLFDFKKGKHHFVLMTENKKSVLATASTDKDYNIIKIMTPAYIKDESDKEKYKKELEEGIISKRDKVLAVKSSIKKKFIKE